MANNDSIPSGGISFTGLLFLVLLVLKLTHYIDWSWWWITSPLWIPVLFMLTVLGIGWLVIMNSDR